MDNSNLKIAAQKWDEFNQCQLGTRQGLSWWETGSAIHVHINQKISGSTEIDWVEYTLKTHLADRLPLDRCLILGCGSGNLERRLAGNDVFKECDAFDISEKSIETARAKATEIGFRNINYRVADVNRIYLDANAYDAIWISAAMHHFEALEHICEQMVQALKPGGLLILYEYIGPNRFQFPTRQKEVANLCMQILPEKYRQLSVQPPRLFSRRSARKTGLRWTVGRVVDKLKDGTLLSTMKRYFRLYRAEGKAKGRGKDEVDFPSARDVISEDPSEAIRSGDIMRVLQQYFDIVEKRDWGGNIVQFLLHGIAGNFSNQDERSQDLLRMLLNIEDIMIRCGEFDSDFAYIVAQPKPRP